MKSKTEELKMLNLNIVRGNEEGGEALTTTGMGKVSSKKKPSTPNTEKKKKGKGAGGGVGGAL